MLNFVRFISFQRSLWGEKIINIYPNTSGYFRIFNLQVLIYNSSLISALNYNLMILPFASLSHLVDLSKSYSWLDYTSLKGHLYFNF